MRFGHLPKQRAMQLDLAMRPGDTQGMFDILLRRRRGVSLPPVEWTSHAVTSTPLSNRPLHAKFQMELAHLLRGRLEAICRNTDPAAYRVLDTLPRTAHGKLDRRRLPALTRPDDASARFVAPRSNAERVLCSAAEQVLGVERIGADDHFFYSGGDSISSIRLVNRAREHGVIITLRDVFQESGHRLACTGGARQCPGGARLGYCVRRTASSNADHALADDRNRAVAWFPPSHVGATAGDFRQRSVLIGVAGCARSS